MKRSAIAAAMLAATAWPGCAAQIEVSGPPGAPVVALVGVIKGEDAAAFQEKIRTLREARVFLTSNGGNVFAAIRIGEMVKGKGFATYVTDYCASACPLIWLAGSKRYMGRNARIGFHQASRVDTGEVSGAGNAIVGSYLTRLGLSYEAIYFATSASPRDIKWMTPEAASRMGIEVSVLDLDPAKLPPAIAAVRRRPLSELVAGSAGGPDAQPVPPAPPRTLSDLAGEPGSATPPPARPRMLSDLAGGSGPTPIPPAHPKTLSDFAGSDPGTRKDFPSCNITHPIDPPRPDIGDDGEPALITNKPCLRRNGELLEQEHLDIIRHSTRP